VFDRAVMEEAAKLIFEDKLCAALDYSSLTLNGLLCFMEYFRYVSISFPVLSFFSLVGI
jgi:hypothetical protein